MLFSRYELVNQKLSKMKSTRLKLLVISFLFLVSGFHSFASPIPKGEHVIWHDGGADYFALSEAGILYSVHENKYHKLYKVKDKELVASIFQMIQENEFSQFPPPKNKEQIIETDKENYKHIEYRKEGRKYETYWTDKDERVEPEFLKQMILKLMELV
ncbi:MAG: hypothetical protein ACI85I_000713 [Arenicella sp.]